MGDKTVRMDDHRPRIVIECDTGDRHAYTESHLRRVAQNQVGLDTIHPNALRNIIRQWLYFVDYISEFADDDQEE